MKPLKDIDQFLKRFDNFRDGEFRSIEINSPTTITLTLAGQDEARAFDWVSVRLEFSGVSDARVIDESKLALVDMSDGISIISEDEKLAFGVGECYNISNTKSSTCHVQAQAIKFEEGLF
jgi:hypothetical protein